MKAIKATHQGFKMEMVWIMTEKCWGSVVKRTPSFCIVRFNDGAFIHEELFEVDELMELNEMGIDYEHHEAQEESY